MKMFGLHCSVCVTRICMLSFNAQEGKKLYNDLLLNIYCTMTLHVDSYFSMKSMGHGMGGRVGWIFLFIH